MSYPVRAVRTRDPAYDGFDAFPHYGKSTRRE